MAIRFDNTADMLARSSGFLDYNAAYTKCGWIYLVTAATDSYNTVYLARGGSGDGEFEGVDIRRQAGGGYRLLLYTVVAGSYTEIEGLTALAVNTWYFFAVVRSGSGLGQNVLGYLGTRGGTVAQEAILASGVNKQAQFSESIGTWNNGSGQDLFSGRFSPYKAWSTALTVTELNAEAQMVTPVRWSNLWQFCPWLTAGDVSDQSGNGRNWTVSGSLTTEDGPPIPWGPPLDLGRTPLQRYGVFS